MKRRATIPNPSSTDGKPVAVVVTGGPSVTDRAHRYRANAVLAAIPESERNCCHFCGNDDEPLLAGHIDGYEENTLPENISPTCRSCNNAIAANFARLEIGRRTRQFNPEAAPARNRDEYRWYTNALRNSTRKGEVIEAIAAIQNTSHRDRNRWAG